MSTTTMNRKKLGGAIIVLTASGVGTLFAAFGALWVAGSLGISTAAASQIVSAIAAGGWALRAVIIVFGAGLIGAIAATVMWFITTKGQGAAIA